jgi:hypothetical protein
VVSAHDDAGTILSMMDAAFTGPPPAPPPAASTGPPPPPAGFWFWPDAREPGLSLADYRGIGVCSARRRRAR